LNFEATFLHFLCSQLVQLRPKDRGHPPETVLLEEITPRGVVLSGVRNYRPGEQFILAADGIEAEVTVVNCEGRESGFVLKGTFGEGYRWSPEEWTPAHLFELKDAPKSKAAGAS
jgi:hypothetical protein